MDFQSIDKSVFFLINHGTANPLFDILMPAVTAKGYLLFVPYLLYILWKSARLHNETGYRMIVWGIVLSFFSVLLSDWLAGEMKHLIERVRPCNTFENVKLLVGCTRSYSMPSNHAANAFAGALPFFYFARRYIAKAWGLSLFAVAALIGFSRIYVGVHYPGDVLAGALLGAVVSILLLALFRYAAGSYKLRPHATILAAGLLAISIFRVYYILHGPLDLSPDEAHYWEWSRRLDLSYYSKGPLIAYLIRTGTALFGDTVFGIRILAVVCSALTSVYLFKLVNLMESGDNAGKSSTASPENSGEGLPGLFTALVFQIIPLFTPFGVIFSIDSPFLLFWTLSLYLFWKTAAGSAPSSSPRYGIWLLLGISIGLGLLAKYTMALFYLCGVLFLLFSEKRYLLRTGGPYAAVLVSLLVFSPVIIWNMRHHWVTIRHTAGQAHVAEGMKVSFLYFFEFLGSQIGAVTPLLFGMMFYALFKLQRTRDKAASRFLFYFSIPVVGFFLLKSIQGKVQANWAITGYITSVVAFSKYFLTRPAPRPASGSVPGGAARCGLLAAAGLALLVTMVGHYPSIVKLPLRLDPSSRLRGWKELGREVSRIYDSMPDKGNVLLFSDSYQVASELSFYVEGHPTSYAINLGRRMNQYDLWPDINSGAREIRQRAGSRQNMINGIFVKIGDGGLPAEVAHAFEKCGKQILKVREKDRLLREYSIFVCSRFQGLETGKPETY